MHVCDVCVLCARVCVHVCAMCCVHVRTVVLGGGPGQLAGSGYNVLHAGDVAGLHVEPLRITGGGVAGSCLST